MSEYTDTYTSTVRNVREGRALLLIVHSCRLCVAVWLCRYQADILAVNAADKSVLVHYQGWHTKWDEWISTNTDRFAPRGSLSSEKKAASLESTGHRHDGTEGGRRAVRQAARVLQLVHGGSKDEARSEGYEHCTDVVVRTRGQAFACLARTRQVWCLDEEGVMEAWSDDSKAIRAPRLTSDQDLAYALDAARALIADCPVLSVSSESAVRQLTLVRTLLRSLLEQDVAAASPDISSVSLTMLNYLTRLVRRSERTQPSLTTEVREALNDIRTLLQTALSTSPAPPEITQTSVLGVLVAGLPLFFPSWGQQFAFASSLHDALSSEPPSLHQPRRLALAALGQAAYHNFSGSSGVGAPYVVEDALVAPSIVAQAERVVNHLRLADQVWLGERLLRRHADSNDPLIPRCHVYLVVSYFSQLYASLQPTSLTPAAARSYSALSSDNRSLAGLLPFLTLSTAVMQRVHSLVMFAMQKVQRVEDETGSRPSPAVVLAAMRSCALFHALPPLLTWLPEVLQLVASGAYEHYMQLDTVLHQLLPLIVDLARLTLPLDSTKSLPLPQLLAALREARQLTTLQSRQGVQRRTLTQFARQVFSGVFRHFASTQPDGGDRELMMSCDDFIRFYSHCHLPPTVAPQQSAASSSLAASPPGAPPSSNIHAPSSNTILVPINSPASPTPAAPPSTAAATVRSSISGSAASAGPVTRSATARMQVISISDGQSDAAGSSSSGLPATSGAPITISFREPFRSPLQSPSPSTSSPATAADNSVAVTIVRPTSHSATSAPSSAPTADSQQQATAAHAATAPLPMHPVSSSAAQPERQPLVRPPFPLVLLPSIGMQSASATSAPYNGLSSSAGSSSNLSRSPSSTSVSISTTSSTRARLLFYKLVLHAGKQSGSEPADSASLTSLTQRQCINLRTFLRFQLEQCKADSNTVMDQLRVLQTSVEWNKLTVVDGASAPTAPGSDLPPIKLTAESMLDDLKRVYSSTLAHLYPALSIVHNAPNPQLPADQLPNVVSMSTLPGITPPPSATITSPQLEYEDVVEKLMESQAHWSQHTAYKQHKDFLQRFVLVDSEQLQRDKVERAKLEERRQVRRSERRQRAQSEQGERQSPRSEEASKASEFAASAPLLQALPLPDEAESDEADNASKEAAERRSKQMHDRARRADDEESLRQLEQHIKAQHDDSSWQQQVSGDPADEEKQPPTSPIPSPASSSVPAANIAVPAAYEISEPALCLSALLQRCLSEMGGGYAKRRVEDWRGALAAERAYAAACIKHHGYTERAMRYSSSIAIVELLRRALQPNSRTRCLSHPSLPHWFKSVVQATFRDVRSPLLSVLRELDEDAADDAKETETSRNDVQSVSPTSDSIIPVSFANIPPVLSSTPSAEELSAAALAARQLVRHAQSNLAALRQEYTSLTAHSQQRTPQTESAATVDDMDNRMAAMLANVSRTRQELEDANNNLRRNITLMEGLVRTTRQKAESDDDKRTAKLRVERARADRRLNVNLEAAALVSDCYENAWFIVSGIDSVQLNVTTDMPGQHLQSVAFDADEPKLHHQDRLTAIRLTPGSRRRHSLLTIQPSQHGELKQLAADVLQQSQADLTHGDEEGEEGEGSERPSSRNQNDSLDPAMMRSYSTRPRHQAKQPSIPATTAAATSLWSTWSVSSAASRAFDSQPFDSSWINQLVHSKSTAQLADSLQPAIQRYHTVSRLRLRLVHMMNSLFSAGKRAELLAHAIPPLLPCLSRSKHGSHLLYNSGLLLREDESQRALLSFYKHNVDALNNPTGGDSSSTTVPLSFSSSSWPVLRQCLHLFNVDFLPEDAEAVVGSGIFAALSRWMTQIDKVLDKHRMHQLGSAADSPMPSVAASRGITRSHTRSSSFTSPGSGKAVTSCPAAYALKRLMWQTYTHLALFYLSQQQQHAQRQLQLDNQTQTDSSTAAQSAEVSKGDNVVNSSLSAMYASALLNNLARLSRAPSRIQFHTEDGLLRETHDAAVMMLHLARLKQPALSPVQLARLAHLVPFAPPATQQSVVQLLGYEVSKVTPREFDVYLNQMSASSTLTSASPIIINSAVAFTSSLLGHLADLIDKASAVSSLVSVCPLFTSQPRRSIMREQKETAESKQQWEPVVDLDESSWRQRMRGLINQAGKRVRTAGAFSDYPTFASPEAVLSLSASTSTYQEWRSGEEQQFNPAQLAVLEELILVLRSLCQDRAWRRLVLPQLIQPVLMLPAATNALHTLHADTTASVSSLSASGFTSASSLCHSVCAGCASLAVLGGWSLCLRRGAYVEVNMQGDFSAELAAPATSSSLPSTVHRGFVQSVDFDAHTATVLVSPSQPRFPSRLYRLDDSAVSAGPAELACMTFSFDQLRSIPAISAPNLNDQGSFATVWSALAAVLEVSPSAAVSDSTNLSLYGVSSNVMLLVQSYMQRLALGVVHSQAVMAVRLQTSSKLSVDTRGAPHLFEDSLARPISPSFGELLASPLIEPLTLSPPPSASEEGGEETTMNFSLASSGDSQSNVTWTLQPLQSTSQSLLAVPSQAPRHGSMSSHRSPAASPEPRAVRQPVDYSVFVSGVMQLSKCASHNFLFSLTAYGVDSASRQLSHRLSSVLSLDVQRRQRVSSLATRLSRVASRATSRAITRSASLHASGTVTPASHEDSKNDQEQQVDALPSFASLSVFPQSVSVAQTTTPSVGRSLLVADSSESAASSVQPAAPETALPGWSAATSQLPSPSSIPHFIHDPSDPLHTPIWSPSPRLDRIIQRLQAQLTHTSAAVEQQQQTAHTQSQDEDEQQVDENEYSEPNTPGDSDDTREIHVHDVDEPIDHADSMFTSHDRQLNVQHSSHTDEDYTAELFDDDEQLDAILDQPPLPSSPPDLSPSLLSAAPDNIIFQYLYGLVSLGYPDHCARFALARCGGDLHAALEFLLSGEITLYTEYTHVGAAMMAFQHLLYRLGLVSREQSGGLGLDAAAGTEGAPLVYRHISIAQQSDRELLVSAIQNLSEAQSSDMSSLALYDWVDARDSYGKRFLAQVVRKRAVPPSVTVHFLAWQDHFQESITLPSERLQPVTQALIDQTRVRLENERHVSRVKVYGPAVHQWISAETVKRSARSAEQLQPCIIYMADPYSFPVLRPPARVEPLSQAALASSELLGARVYVTPECIALLHSSLCLPAVDVASEYVVGNKLLVVDTVGKLCEAEITEVRGTEIRIHYPGWGGKWDETLSVHSARIQGRQGSNKRRVREGSVMPGSDSARQLYELVGSTGIIVEVTKGCKLEGGERSRGRADKADDSLVRVEVLDDRFGSVITFRTRLALLKRVEPSDTPQLSQSALLAMTRSQLMQTNTQLEQSALAARAGQLLQTLTLLTSPRPAADARVVKLHQLLDALSINNRLSMAAGESARNGWADSVYGQVGESCVVVPARHVQPWTQSVEQDAPAPPEGTELTLDAHPHPLTFRSSDPPGPGKEEWRVCDVCHCPRTGPMFVCGQCAHRQCMVCTVHALPFAHPPPPSRLSSPLAKDDDMRETDADKAAQWLDTTAYRSRGRGADKEKLQLLDSLTHQLLESMPDSGDMQLRWLSPSTLAMLEEEVEQVARLLNQTLHSLAGPERKSSENDETLDADTSMLSLLGGTALTEVKAGQRVRLHIDSPDVDSLLVAWVRNSQPNFDLHFYQCAPMDPSTTTVRPTAPPASAPSAHISGTSEPRQTGVADEESIQLTEESSRALSEPTATAITAPPSDTVRTHSTVCQPVDTVPPALMCLRSLPPLKSAGVPLLLPNPCYVCVGGVRRGKDEIADVSDDELQIVVTPVKRTSLEGIALWAELLMHVRREWMLTLAHTTTESVPLEVLLRLRVSHQRLWAMFVSVVDEVMSGVTLLLSSCPWPSAIAARYMELAAHLGLAAMEVLNLPASHPLSMAADNLPRVNEGLVAKCMDAAMKQWQMRWMIESPFSPLYSAYCHRLTECLIATTMSALTQTQHREYQELVRGDTTQPQLHRHELTRAVLRVARLIDTHRQKDRLDNPISTILSAPSLYEQSGHTADCPCQYCQTVTSKQYRAGVMLMDFNSPFWALAMGCSSLTLPPAHRYALFDDVINATANADKTQPEFILYTPKDKALESAALSSSVTAHASADEASVMRQLFLQLSNTSPTHFRHKLGEISFKALFKGPFHRGAQGTPGPFRQVLTDVCADLRRSSPTSLLIPCPNFTHDTGLNRNQLLLNPGSGVRRSDAEALGRLMGIALRSGGVLDIDIAAIVWKQLVGQQVEESELAHFDFTAHNTLRFRDYTNPDEEISEEEWNDNYGQLTWTTLASDGLTRLQLRQPSTARPYVLYSERKLYARAVVQARFSESVHLLDCVKAGLYSIVPRAALSVLRWTELRHRVCGDSEVDLDVLAAHTVYAPKKFTAESPIIHWLWNTLRSFSSDERGKFLQFCLARSRLPPTTSREGSWRMKVNVLEAANQRDLPTAETWSAQRHSTAPATTPGCEMRRSLTICLACWCVCTVSSTSTCRSTAVSVCCVRSCTSPSCTAPPSTAERAS